MKIHKLVCHSTEFRTLCSNENVETSDQGSVLWPCVTCDLCIQKGIEIDKGKIPAKIFTFSKNCDFCKKGLHHTFKDHDYACSYNELVRVKKLKQKGKRNAK